jgi:hypothetical protein
MKNLIRYYKVLQPLFVNKMGDMFQGEKLYDEKEEKIFTICTGLLGFFVDENQYSHNQNDCLRIPLTIDVINPERGLWEMLDWDKCVTGIYSDGKLRIWRTDIYSSEKWYIESPTEVILRALCNQEGIKV